MKLKTARLLIYTISDVEMERLAEDETDPELRLAYTEMLQGCMQNPKQRIWYAIWLIESKEYPGTILGDLSFKGLNPNGMVEIGYGLRDGYCGHGYMTEAVIALSKWALAQEGVTCVEAETEPDNLRSQAVLRRAGYVATGQNGAEGPRFRFRATRRAVSAFGR